MGLYSSFTFTQYIKDLLSNNKGDYKIAYPSQCGISGQLFLI